MCIESLMHRINEMYEVRSKQKTLILLCLGIAITIGLTSTTYSGFATDINATWGNTEYVEYNKYSISPWRVG